MKNFKKLISLALAGIMILGSITPVFANIEETQQTNENGNLSTDVYFNQYSTFSVVVPKKVVLDSNKESLYTVEVTSDISSDETVLVEPDETFFMKDLSTINTKADIEASVTQDKTTWLFNEFETIANGVISAPTLTAGNWEGKFYFNIKLDSNTVKVVSITDSTGTNLNGKGKNITGYEKEKLLSELATSELVEDIANVKAIIDVNTDDFENSATATFDVSKIAEVGNQIAVYHYDEDLSAWELIETVTVDDNGKITVNMNSFSPVAFVIPNELKAGLYDANGVMLCTWEESGISLVDCTWGATTASPCNVLKNKYPTTATVVFPDSTTRIGSYTFVNCTNLTTIIIPSGVTSIGTSAFSGCTGLTSVTFKDTSNWYVGGNENAATTKVDLTDVETNATYLKSTYCRTNWYKK